MVVGHVQSGKTANYIGLICKAADSGYRVIIVLAGMLNSLRNQTQGRLDIGFVGRNTLSKEEIGVMRLVGASKIYVRGPFIVEGVIYGVIATIINMILFWPVTVYFGNNMTGFLGFNLYDYYISNFSSYLT
jgi:hypothetical protein